MQDKTETATITQAEVDAAEETDAALQALERLNATYESYGAFPVLRPKHSDRAVFPADLLKVS